MNVSPILFRALLAMATAEADTLRDIARDTLSDDDIALADAATQNITAARLALENQA